MTDDTPDYVTSGIVEADRLETFAETLRSLVHEAKLHFGDEGVMTSAVDPANVAMFHDTGIERAGFESFESPGEVVHGVNLDRLVDLLDGAASDDLVEFGIDMETRKLDIRYRGIEHRMGLIDPDSIRQEPDRADLDLPNHVVLSGAQIHEAIDNCTITSDHVFLRGDPEDETMTFAAQGDVDETTITYDAGECDRFDVSEATESVFSLEYLEDMKAEIPDDAAVAVHFGEEFPAHYDYTAGEGHLRVEGMIAPRIRSD